MRSKLDDSIIPLIAKTILFTISNESINSNNPRLREFVANKIRNKLKEKIYDKIILKILYCKKSLMIII